MRIPRPNPSPSRAASPGLSVAAIAVFAVAALTGCTQVLHDAPARKYEPIGPITAGQVSDLLSDRASLDPTPNLFTTVEPEECAGLAREVDPPFIFDITPAAHDGGHWLTDDDYFSIQEMVGVYPADYDPAAAVDAVRRTVRECDGTRLRVTAMSEDVLNFEALPGADSGSPQIVLWRLENPKRGCDNAFIAAHNAAIEMTACGSTSGFDIKTTAEEALARINALADLRA